MHRYFSKTQKSSIGSTSTSSLNVQNVQQSRDLEFNPDDVVTDPGLRKPIETFDVNIRDRIRREYIVRGPCQPIGHSFPKRKIGADNRSFRDIWFEGRPWLEYNVDKDAAFCFYCYLFRKSNEGFGGHDAFVKSGFVNWQKGPAKFTEHVGGVNSSHNKARELFENFMNQRQSVTRALMTGKEVMDDQYTKRLTASLNVIRFLLRQGLPFRGDNEGFNSLNKGNFLELLDWLSANNADMLRQTEHDRIVGMLENMEISSGTGLNQETSLCRPCDTRWGTHYITICRLMDMWPSVITVLQAVFDDGQVDCRGQAHSLIKKMEKYDFVFIMVLMRKLLRMKHALSNTLQAKDQNIDNAIHQIGVVKDNLQEFRDEGLEYLLDEVNGFCQKYSIRIIDMEASRKKGSRHLRATGATEIVTNHHFFRVEIFYDVVDRIRQEMDNRFPETSTELLSCISCLSPRPSFSSFDIDKTVRLTLFYPDDFNLTELSCIQQELETYVKDVRKDVRFTGLYDLGSLGKKMVETLKHKVFPLVFRLIELALVLSVATTSVERVFSAMNVVKIRLRNKMRDQWMNDSLIVYIQKEVFNSVNDLAILQRF